MSDHSPEHLIESLSQLLDEERQALIGGDLEKIGKLMPAKEEIINDINSLNLQSGQNISEIQEKVTRNQALLNSALEGIQAVANRMSDLRRVRSGLETYDHRGQKKTYKADRPTRVEKRA